ncbi:MAG: hypothetical protein M0R77_12765 [Gammaproteobacteria bacterium]|jgi:hypothetical protein|nr:hypothetical protein [Gammaproteobacteria bacterium]
MKTMYLMVKVQVPTDDEENAFDILENVDYTFKDNGIELDTEIMAWGDDPNFL